MKRLSLVSALVALSTLVAPAANATGWIVVDPITPGGAAVVRPPVVRPGRPGGTVRPPGRNPLLQGQVSFGLHLKGEAVKVDIADQVAKTYISQTFTNDTDQMLAGTYLFPLPEDTTFSSFSLHIDGKPVEGKILEAQAARQEYESIVRRQVDPGLLEYADYKTVRARIFPIPPRGEKKVELEYTQVLKADGGMLKYRFPLKASQDAEPAEEIKIDVKLNSKQALKTIWSPSHTITSKRSDDNNAKVSFLEQNTLPDKDFMLYYSVSDKDMAANILTHKKTSEDGYFMLTLSPPVEVKNAPGKDVVIVTDTSGSMDEEKMKQNKEALKFVIGALKPEDNFSIVQFNTDVDSFKSKLVPATDENKKAAREYIDDLEAHGGTNIGDAINTAKTILGSAQGRSAYMLLITDGEPTVGETNVESLLKSFKPERPIHLFDFGVGYDINTRLLNRLASEHHGASQYVEPGESLETAISTLYQKIKSPVLSDVKMTYDGIQVKDMYPREVSDIFAGSQVLLIGRYKGAGDAKVTVSGTINGAKKDYVFPVTFTGDEAGHTYLPRLWAMRRIGHLTEVAQANGDNKEIVDEIVALSKKYGIISAYTSYLVTDPAENERLRQMGFGTGARWRAAGGGGAAGAVPPPPPMVTLSTMAPFAGAGAGAAMGTGSGRASHFAFRPGSFSPTGKPVAAMPTIAMDGFIHTTGDSARSSVPQRLANAKRTGSALHGSAMPEARGGDAWGEQIYGDEGVTSLDSFVLESGAMRAELAAAPESGKKAVAVAKTVERLKDTIALDKEKSSAIKSVEDKTFYLIGGVWTESSFDEGNKSIKPQEVVFGTDSFFELVKNKPGIAKYLGVGRQVLVEFDGQWYKVVQPKSAMG